MVYEVIILGGGASGMAAAITAAGRGLKTAVIEKNDRIGKKLLSTGNGRCNLAGSLPVSEMYNTAEVEKVFVRVGLKEILEFFKSLGLMVREEDNRYYPYSGQASAVLNVLRAELERLGVDVYCGAEARKITGSRPFTVFAGKKFSARNVILSTGNIAGSGTDSLHLYSAYGHKAKKAYPSLVPVLTDTAYIKNLKGVRLTAEARLLIDNRLVRKTKDEIIFKDNGLSGSAVFTLSTALARLGEGKRAVISLDFVPELTGEELEKEISERLSAGRGLEGIFHKELVSNLERRLGSKICPENAKKLAGLIKNFEINVKELSSPSLAQVMSGGLLNSGFDFSTMESVCQKGLYATGEALDVDGECGGYNLMWAWASGIVAGESVK